MRHETGIQWTHVPGYVGATWNPTVGCTRVSPGCDNCYAFTLHDQRYVANREAARDAWFGYGRDNLAATARADGVKLPLPPQYDVPFSTVQMLDEKRLTAPLRARKPHAYFVDSMADLFHEDVTDGFLDRVFAVMALSAQHIFMILTKRPERMREYLSGAVPLGVTDRGDLVERSVDSLAGDHGWHAPPFDWPLPNVWLGVSAEDQDRADERIPLLLDTPAAVRFVSYEPALGPVDFRTVPIPVRGPRELAISRLDWIIVGGESGARARPFDIVWARSVVDQCRRGAAAVFVKQLGAEPIAQDFKGLAWDVRLRNRHGSEMAEWPEDLRVREWPSVVRA